MLYEKAEPVFIPPIALPAPFPTLQPAMRRIRLDEVQHVRLRSSLRMFLVNDDAAGAAAAITKLLALTSLHRARAAAV